jgi:NADPH:quinone reductase-like Zn-dependent oxidoreductase
MLAAVRRHYGPPEALQIAEMPIPKCGKKDVLVRIHASTVSRTDCGVLEGKPFILRFFTGLSRPKLPITGTDFAGIVVSVGSKVQTFKQGDRVFGFNDEGLASHAEYALVPAEKAIALIPDHVSFSEAAASCEGAHYAYNFIKDLQPRAGQHALVNGATGGIGSAAIQLLHNAGVRVTAVCAGEHMAKVMERGAKAVIDYTQTDFTNEPGQYDFVVDAVGKSSFARSKKVLKPGGIYISSELGPNASNIYLSIFRPLTGNKKVIFPLPNKLRESILFMQGLLQAKKFSPLTDRTYPLSEIQEAFRYVLTGKKIGNVILEIGST